MIDLPGLRRVLLARAAVVLFGFILAFSIAAQDTQKSAGVQTEAKVPKSTVNGRVRKISRVYLICQNKIALFVV
jgi:hypothetical protein